MDTLNIDFKSSDTEVKRKEALAALKGLMRVLNDESNPYSKHLWFLISAMRGPDNESPLQEEIKQEITAKLRYIAGIKITGLIHGTISPSNICYSHGLGRYVNPGPLDYGAAYTLMEGAKMPSHFWNHVRNAFHAIEMLDIKRCPTAKEQKFIDLLKKGQDS